MPRMLFSELYKIMVKKVTFVGYRGESPPLWISPWTELSKLGDLRRSLEFLSSAAFARFTRRSKSQRCGCWSKGTFV